MHRLMHRPTLALWILCGAISGSVTAQTSPDEVSFVEIRTAVSKAIPLIEKSAAGSAEQRKCFTCHNQAMPVLALYEARLKGFTVDEANFQRQVDHTYDHLKRGQKDYLEAKGQGGQVDTAGYALWTLQVAQRPPDEVTAAVAHYLVEYQSDQPHWKTSSQRPPSEASHFTASYLAVLGLKHFGTPEQQDAISNRFAKLRDWLGTSEVRDHEDRVFRLLTLVELDSSAEQIETAAQDLAKRQRDDGGWSQTDDMESDAYATGTALVALYHAGKVDTTSASYQRGLQFLLQDQCDDGSWHVVSRSKPFQTYFETGFPHEKDQFISCSAACWATWALTVALPNEP